jgi:hypothetical protein
MPPLSTSSGSSPCYGFPACHTYAKVEGEASDATAVVSIPGRSVQPRVTEGEYSMGESGQLRALEAVGDWSKWLVGVNLTAAGGCVAVLQTGVAGTPRLFLLGAIGLFIVGLLAATALLALLPRLIEQLPVLDDEGHLRSIYEGQLWRAVHLRMLVLAQFGLFVLALLNFAGWVLTKPLPR